MALAPISQLPSATLLTTEGVARVLDVGQSTVEEWIRRREIASFKKGRIRRIEFSAVLEFIARHRVVATDQGTKGLKDQGTWSEREWERIERLITEKLKC